MITRRLVLTAGAVAAIGAGVYFFVYLYRWEWNRAIIAGIIFLAAEIAFAASAIMNRLSRMESRAELDRGERIREHLHAAPFTPRASFDWLTRSSSDLNVFVPVLLGAGVMASALAWVVERIAFATARPVVEEQLTTKLVTMSWPAEGLLGKPATRPEARARRWLCTKQIVIAIATLALLAAAIDAVGDLTQSRPDRHVAGTASVVTIDLSHRSARAEPAEIARSLWSACRTTVPGHDLTGRGVVGTSANRYDLNIGPALGKYAERRLQGCLSDATLDHVQARVVSVKDAPT
ncbi:MAG: hypothetical protein ACRDKZ_06390 [Actinomycetota bacterium]